MHILGSIDDLNLIHFTVEGVLAVFLGLLCRRLHALRAQMPAIEAAQEKAKRRSETATGGLHLRLLTVERHLRQAQAHSAALAPAPAARRAAPAGTSASAVVAAPKSQLTRGEMDLFLKVRQMNGKET